VGYCGFARTNAPWLRLGIIEIGWLLDRRRWGEGLATEGARAVLPLAVARFQPWRIVSKCNLENVASEAVMRRLGLKRAGVVRRPQDFTVVYRLPT
jgi:RimJ/RimL family protein N-acetyltransferase